MPTYEYLCPKCKKKFTAILSIKDHQDNRVTHFVVSAGLLLKERKLIPVLWISTIGEKKVRLSVDAGTLERLPGYSGAG